MAKSNNISLDDKISKTQKKTISDIKNLDSAVQKILSDNRVSLVGTPDTTDISKLHNEFTNLVKMDSFNFSKSKTDDVSSFSYLVNSITGKKTARFAKNNKDKKLEDIQNRINLENVFKTADAQTASIFLNQSSDIFHICDEIESICAFLYQLDEGVNLLRDNILNTEQVLNDLPFNI